MLKRLPVALAQVKTGNTSENLLNEIRQIMYSLNWEKEASKTVCNNIMNSIKLYDRMDTIFMNSGNNKTSNLHRLLLNLSDKINLKRSDKYVALSNLIIYYSWTNIKKPYKNNKFSWIYHSSFYLHFTNIFTHIFNKGRKSIVFYKYLIFRLNWISNHFLYFAL